MDGWLDGHLKGREELAWYNDRIICIVMLLYTAHVHMYAADNMKLIKFKETFRTWGRQTNLDERNAVMETHDTR
jgi:hypothetical protein